MQMTPSDPDIETIVGRIKSGDINLQPEFQRGEVWTQEKKRRLIDTVLRNWHIPPVHVVVIKDTGKQEVLDGQQRLVAIRDFMNGEFVVDGEIEPADEKIKSLSNFKYFELPEVVRKAFNSYSIRMFKISDYDPGEPAELFYRLNQPTNLTAAEKRNAFFGPAREQIKTLKDSLESGISSEEFLGFSNARMALEDVLARACLTIERKTLSERISSTAITEKFRSKEAFDKVAFRRISAAVKLLSSTCAQIDESIKLNKATLFSWLIFFARLEVLSDPSVFKSEVFSEFLTNFEKARWLVRQNTAGNNPESLQLFGKITTERSVDLFRIYNDRASSRVADVSSVVSRDLILWVLFSSFISSRNDVPIVTEEFRKTTHSLWSNFNKFPKIQDSDLMLIASGIDWGKTL